MNKVMGFKGNTNKVAKDCIADTKDNNQLVYVDKYGFIEFSDRYPSVTAK